MFLDAPSVRKRERGLTLVELMISMVLGLLVVMSASTLLLSTKAAYHQQTEEALLDDTGRFALEMIGRSLRQAAYENWDASEAPLTAPPEFNVNIQGLDGHRLKATSEGIVGASSDAVNGSDVLSVRFFGSGKGENGDGTSLNCAGFGVSEPASQQTADSDRGWSIFYVATSSDSEPHLYCKYRGEKGWAAVSIARGVESFQVLYGVDIDGDAQADRIMAASAVNELDKNIAVEGADASELAADRNRKSHWKKVTMVKVALLVRGNADTSRPASLEDHHLFGKDYSDVHGMSDTGVRLVVDKLPFQVRMRPRRVFATTIHLRNAASGSRQ